MGAYRFPDVVSCNPSLSFFLTPLIGMLPSSGVIMAVHPRIFTLSDFPVDHLLTAFHPFFLRLFFFQTFRR